MKKNPTFEILVFLLFVYLISTIANAYFIFYPSGYTPHEFDPYSFLDWFVILSKMLIAVYLFLFARAVRNKYAKIFWLYATIVILFGIIEFFIKYPTEPHNLFSVFKGLISLIVLLMFLLLYRKHNFNLLEGVKENHEFSMVARKVTGVLFASILLLAIWMLFRAFA